LVFWGQAMALSLQTVVVLIFFLRSDWPRCVLYARQRQERNTPADLASVTLLGSPGRCRIHFHTKTMYAAADFSPKSLNKAMGYPVASPNRVV